jgi:hypothetical protein
MVNCFHSMVVCEMHNMAVERDSPNPAHLGSLRASRSGRPSPLRYASGEFSAAG